MRRPRTNERGATAILVAMVSTVMLVLSGFTVDFGQAFMSKRNLQKAADAGALAAAQVLTAYPGTCNQVASNSAAVLAAHLAADSYRTANRESYLSPSTETEFSVSCDPQLKVLVVKYGVQGSTNSAFGPLAGASSTLTTDRRAEATVDVSPIANDSVRPLALCSAQLPPPAATDTFVRVDYPKNSVNPPAGCPIKTGSGNWWTVDCPGENSGSASDMSDQILNGCGSSVSVVPGTEDVLTPGELTVRLEAQCDAGQSADGTCLSGDPGNIDSGQVADAWKILVQQETEAIFPVFCAPPQCSASTTEGTGTNATYPVYKLVGAVICGYHFSKTERFHSSSGACSGLPTSMFAGNDDAGNEANYLVIKYIRVRTSGSNGDSPCALGAECDGGLRRTRITG